jgi:hypothetical protein
MARVSQYLQMWDIAKRQQSQRYVSAIRRFQHRYTDVMQRGERAVEAAGELPEEFAQVAELYAPGGQYGEGARERVRQTQRTGTAAGMAQLARTGMSSGTLAEGVRARYAREAETSFKEVQDVQYGRYAEALQTLGAAKEARYGRTAQIQLSLAQLGAQMQEPTYGSFGSQIDVAGIGAAGAAERARLAAKTAKFQTAAGIYAQRRQQISAQTFQAGEAKKQRTFAATEAEKARYFTGPQTREQLQISKAGTLG